MKLAWGAKVSPEFRARVLALCQNVGIADPSWLMACMAFESRLNPAARNPTSGAVGLIQFMPSTASALGIPADQLAKLSAEAQLEFVEKYFLPFKGRIQSFTDCYAAILWPKAVGQPDEFPLFVAGSSAYAQNAGLDTNQDHQVTKAEAAAFVAKRYEEGLQEGNVFETEPAPSPAAAPREEKAMPVAIPLLLSLIPQVLSLFAPRAQAQVQRVTGADADAAAAFYQSLIQKLGQVVNVPVVNDQTAVQAVAAITANPEPAKVKELEDHSLDYLDKLAPVLDKLAGYDRERWEASVAGMDAASRRARQDRYDSAPVLVKSSEGLTWFIISGLFAAIGFSIYLKADAAIWTGLVGLIGPMLTIVMKGRQEIFAYRWDGTKESEATNAAMSAIAQKK